AAADSAVALANANVVRAIQRISTERGRDPRDYVLVPYGGAGAPHAATGAQELGIAPIFLPPSPRTISPSGLAPSDFQLFESMTHRALADDAAADVLRDVFHAMRARALERARANGLGTHLAFTFSADMRFVGQAFEVPVPFLETELASLTAASVRQ